MYRRIISENKATQQEIRFAWVCRNKTFGDIRRVELTDLMLLRGNFPAWIISDNCEIIAKIRPTGLKDCKGREVYEGDIVRVTEIPTPGRNRRSIYGPEFIAPVIWNDRDTGFTLAYQWSDTGKIDDHIHIDPTETEVIGNIYQNPELLEAKPWK